tara:strand:+ start:395 stop:604 length:210 start_codon:yes stop_codon:yes gene_type:complete
MIYKGPEISTYWGSDEYSDRKANVMKNDEGFYIDMYKKEQLVESRPLYDHSEVYAESAAENYVMGILNP